MNYHAGLFCFLLAASLVNAQKPGQATRPKPTSDTTAEQKQAGALREMRRQAAIGALNSMADEARSYSDEALRAKVQARIADALWDNDTERSRGLFRRAWEAAELVEGQTENSRVASVSGRVSTRPGARPRIALRSEILRLAAKRDRALGEEFLGRLTSLKDDTSPAPDSSVASRTPNLSPAAIAQRLSLASEFLEAGDVQRALQFADPALGQVVNRAISFLIALREKNAAAADQRFTTLLSLSATDPAADANTLSLLFSIRMGMELASPTDLAEVFGALANDDLFHALSVARDFKGEAPRALTTIAAAHAVLSEKLPLVK